jgi:hypothetical protein
MPTPRLGAPLLTYSICMDPLSAKGVRLDLSMAQVESNLPLGDDLALLVSCKEKMEEILRRGGASMLPGWIWNKLKAAQTV